MSGDLISRSALTDAIGRLHSVGGAYLFDPDDVYAAIEAAKAVDAVEVVRCRECKHYWAPDADFYDSVCKRHKGLVGPTDESYCSYGERKDNGKAD